MTGGKPDRDPNAGGAGEGPGCSGDGEEGREDAR
jgi:hypothetical protein